MPGPAYTEKSSISRVVEPNPPIRTEFDGRVNELLGCLGTVKRWRGGTKDKDSVYITVVDRLAFNQFLDSQINGHLRGYDANKESLGSEGKIAEKFVEPLVLQLIKLEVDDGRIIDLNHGLTREAYRLFVGEFDKDEFEDGWNRAMRNISEFSMTKVTHNTPRRNTDGRQVQSTQAENPIIFKSFGGKYSKASRFAPQLTTSGIPA